VQLLSDKLIKCPKCERAKRRRERAHKPRFLIDNTVTKRKKRNMRQGWTMVLCFSRAWCVYKFFADFERLEFDRSKCHLLIYNNVNNPLLDKLLKKRAKRYQQWHKQKYGERKTHSPFASVRLFKSFRKYGGIVFGQEASFDKSKLPTIFKMQQDIVNMITTDKFFMIEDDTRVPPYAVKRLFRKLSRDKDIGIVSGVEPTRSPRLTDKARLGAYYLLRKGTKIYERISLNPDLRGFQECDAVGFYCLAARTKAWKDGYNLFVKEFEKQKTAEPNWAIDTIWTNNIKRCGYKVIADMETPCLHMQIKGDRIYNWAIDRSVVKLDYYIRKYNVYAQGVDLSPQKEKS